MKNILFVCLGLLLVGCSTVQEGDYGYVPEALRQPPAPRQSLTSIDQVKEGMTYQEVMALMGDQVKIGFQQGDEAAESFGAVGLRNPYQIEMLEAGGVQHLVVYYVTKINNSDGQITNDELTPVIFKDNLMLGKGWDFFDSLKSM